MSMSSYVQGTTSVGEAHLHPLAQERVLPAVAHTKGDEAHDRARVCRRELLPLAARQEEHLSVCALLLCRPVDAAHEGAHHDYGLSVGGVGVHRIPVARAEAREAELAREDVNFKRDRLDLREPTACRQTRLVNLPQTVLTHSDSMQRKRVI